MFKQLLMLVRFLKGGVPTTVEDTEPLPVVLPDAQVDELKPLATQPVSGTVELGAASLSALENITVEVSNEVEIKNDSANPVPVSGTVDLSGAALAALELIGIKGADGAAIAGATNPLPVALPGIERDANNQTTTSPGASSTYTGTYTDRRHFGYGLILVISNEELASALIRYSNDGVNPISGGLLAAPTNLTHVAPVAPSTLHIYFAFVLDLRVAPYYRVEATTTATDPTTFEVASFWSPHPFQGSFGSADAALNVQNRYLNTRAIVAGQRADGSLVNLKANDLAFESDVELGGGGVLISDGIGTDGWDIAELYVATDQESGVNGIEIEYTPDAQAVIPDWLPGPKYTFTAADVVAGFVQLKFSTALDGLRLRYTNGGVAQGSFYIALTLRVNATSPQNTLTSSISATATSVMGRNAIFASNAAGDFGLIPRGDLGGLRVDVDALTGATQMNQAAVIGTASQIAASPLTGRRSITFIAPTSNTKIICIGKNNAITFTSGSVPLGPGASLTIDIDDTDNTWWAIAESGTQRVAWIEVS